MKEVIPLPDHVFNTAYEHCTFGDVEFCINSEGAVPILDNHTDA